MLSLLQRGNTVAFHAIGRAGDSDDELFDRLRADGVVVTDSSGTGIDGMVPALDQHTPAVAIVQRPGPALACISALHERPQVARVYWGHDIHSWRLAAQNRVRHQTPDHAERLTVLAERRDWAAYDVCAYPAAREADFVNAEVPGARAEAIPYFRLGPQDRAVVAPHAGRSGALMVGGAAHMPNRDAVEFTVADVLPLTGDMPLTVVGTWPRELIDRLQRPGVEFTGRVSDRRLLQLHHESLCLLAPLRFGAGTRRKLVAAMGLGLPVVTTSEGAQGLLVRDATADDGVLIADDPAALARHVRQLHDPDVWTRASRAVSRRASNVYRTSAYDAGIDRVLRIAASRRDARLGGP
jgi:glycosyltransferase involved in cell wall biosynthesis